MANQWFKFYGGEYLSDPKMLSLTGSERSCWLTLLCYASMSGKDGIISHLTEEMLMTQSGIKPLRKDWETTKGIFKKLENLGMIDIKTNEIHIKNWRIRQEMYLTGAERAARYREKNPEKSRQSVFYARLRKMGINPAKWEKIKEKQKYKCAECGLSEPEISLTLDHKIPTSKGGTNRITNIQALCGSCNSKKGDSIGSNAEVTQGSNESKNGSNARIEENRIDKNRIEEKRGIHYLTGVPDKDMKEFLTRFVATEKEIKSKAEDLLLYCQRKGRTYSNYKAFLLNALKRDFKERSEKGGKYAHLS